MKESWAVRPASGSVSVLESARVASALCPIARGVLGLALRQVCIGKCQMNGFKLLWYRTFQKEGKWRLLRYFLREEGVCQSCAKLRL